MNLDSPNSSDSPSFPICSHVQNLQKIPQYAQRSDMWYKQRRGALTASDVPTVLGDNPYKTPFKLLLEKCGMGPVFTGNDATRWGQVYEDVAIKKYESLRGKKQLDFGLLIHPEYSWLGGSPDGITTDGILLEVKCPYRRKIIHGQFPKHYEAQILLNIEISDLEMGHFIEFVPGNSDNEYEINIVEVPRNREWFAQARPKLKEFWDSVVHYREVGIEQHPQWTNYYNRSQNMSSKRSNDNGLILDFCKVTKKCHFVDES